MLAYILTSSCVCCRPGAGGEYGSVNHVAEHAPNGRRLHTSWIQTTATRWACSFRFHGHSGASRMMTTESRSMGLAYSVPGFDRSWYLRLDPALQMSESPPSRNEGRRQDIKSNAIAAGQWEECKNCPWIGSFGLTAGQAVIWYSGQFYAHSSCRTYSKLKTNCKMSYATVLVIALDFSTFGWLSDITVSQSSCGRTGFAAVTTSRYSKRSPGCQSGAS